MAGIGPNLLTNLVQCQEVELNFFVELAKILRVESKTLMYTEDVAVPDGFENADQAILMLHKNRSLQTHVKESVGQDRDDDLPRLKDRRRVANVVRFLVTRQQEVVDSLPADLKDKVDPEVAVEFVDLIKAARAEHRSGKQHTNPQMFRQPPLSPVTIGNGFRI